MSLPFNKTLKLWSALEASETDSYIGDVETFPVARFGQLKLTLYAADFTGNLDFQSSADGTHWFNVPYFRSDTDAALTAGIVDATINMLVTAESRSYVVPGGPWPYFRIVMVRTAGSISATLQGYEHDSGIV